MNRICLFLLLFCFALPCYARETDFLVDTLDASKISKPIANLDYNYQDTLSVPIKLKITEKISTKDPNLYEGKIVRFKAQAPAFYKGYPLVKEGDVVLGKVKLITQSGLNGIPYSILIDDFKINNLDSNKLKSGYLKSGFNRTYFVLPLKWALTPLPPTGSLTNFIKGGHAKITQRDNITLYYYPNWAK